MDENSWKLFKEKKLAALNKALLEGKVDIKIIPVLEIINSYPNLLTTSSCSGRILLLKIKKSKKDAKKFFVWHDKLDYKEFLAVLSKIKSKKYFWLRVEPFILHIVSKDLESAKKILLVMKKSGIKRGGINFISNKITLEIMGHTQLLVPLELISNKKLFLKYANNLLSKNEKKLEKFKNMLKTTLFDQNP